MLTYKRFKDCEKQLEEAKGYFFQLFLVFITSLESEY